MPATPPPAIYATPSPSPNSARSEIDASVEYESQFADVIFSGSARYDLIPHGTVLPYAKLLVDYDTRSGVPGLGEVFNTDAIVPSLGIRAPLGRDEYGELFVQGGYSFGLRSQPSFPETRWGFDYSRDYGSSFHTVFPHLQVNGELIDYSRFAGNTIGLAYAYYDARIVTSLRALIGGDVSFDTHREYANNYGEVYGGFLVPLSEELDLQLAGVEGVYLSRGVDVPAQPWYSSVRVTLTHAIPP